MIELDNVHKTLGGKPILRGQNMHVHAGETFVIIGRSGIGKSVTLRHIVGLMQPDQGTVRVLGRDLSELTEAQLRDHRRKVGYLFQDGALLNWLSLGENVALPLREHLRLKNAEVESKVMEILALVELQDAVAKFPSEISGGMRKRAGLARALILRPEVVLYDEPTSGLDPISSSVINRLIGHLKATLKITQVVVTHDMSSAYEIGDRIALLHGGRLEEIGTPEVIRQSRNPAVVQFIHGDIEGPLSTHTTPSDLVESESKP